MYWLRRHKLFLLITLLIFGQFVQAGHWHELEGPTQDHDCTVCQFGADTPAAAAPELPAPLVFLSTPTLNEPLRKALAKTWRHYAARGPPAIIS